MQDNTDESEAGLKIGWPPIDLNEVAGVNDKANREPNACVAYAGAFLLAVVSLFLTPFKDCAPFGVLVSFGGFVWVFDAYYREREHHTKWANALAWGFFTGHVIFLAVALSVDSTNIVIFVKGA